MEDGLGWERGACSKVARLIESGALTLPSSQADVLSFLQGLWDVFAPMNPGADSIHSKVLNVASVSGEYFGFYSVNAQEIERGVFAYEGPLKSSSLVQSASASSATWHGVHAEWRVVV